MLQLEYYDGEYFRHSALTVSCPQAWMIVAQFVAGFTPYLLPDAVAIPVRQTGVSLRQDVNGVWFKSTLPAAIIMGPKPDLSFLHIIWCRKLFLLVITTTFKPHPAAHQCGLPANPAYFPAPARRVGRVAGSCIDRCRDASLRQFVAGLFGRLSSRTRSSGKTM